MSQMKEEAEKILGYTYTFRKPQKIPCFPTAHPVKAYWPLRTRKLGSCTMEYQHIFRLPCVTTSKLHTRGGVGRRGSIVWPPRFLDLNPLGFVF
ncbi:hypothetical protein TNCV_3062891 [Trichonephila clavipes]|nr:hypothetical protein TNCV_3062891 [Trichonephila clavipes]